MRTRVSGKRRKIAQPEQMSGELAGHDLRAAAWGDVDERLRRRGFKAADVPAGIVAGLVGTAAMTAVMQGIQQWRAPEEPLPPEEIITRTAEKVGQAENLEPEELFWLTWTSHFAYGATMGGLFVPVQRRFRLPPVTSGVAYGLTVWAASYLGWLPALRILPSATKWPADRNAMMIAAHVVWGASLGLIAGGGGDRDPGRLRAAGGRRR